jgi:starvation-inducible DNA-binding protein
MSYEKLVKEAAVVVSAPASSELAGAVTKVLADAFVFYFKAHSFHWNVVGKDFPQLHDFFGNIYLAVFANVDRLAEEIRALDAMAPMNLATLLSEAAIMENKSTLDGMSMVAALAADNQKILSGLLACQKMAEAANQVGLANFLQDLYDSHKKFAWQFSAILKG